MVKVFFIFSVLISPQGYGGIQRCRSTHFPLNGFRFPTLRCGGYPILESCGIRKYCRFSINSHCSYPMPAAESFLPDCTRSDKSRLMSFRVIASDTCSFAESLPIVSRKDILKFYIIGICLIIMYTSCCVQMVNFTQGLPIILTAGLKNITLQNRQIPLPLLVDL